MIEEKIGEVLGLEMAAQKAVDQLVSKGLLEKGSIMLCLVTYTYTFTIICYYYFFIVIQYEILMRLLI